MRSCMHGLSAPKLTHVLCHQAIDILMAKEVIAVNQDPLGVAGDLIWKEGPNEVCTRSPHDSANDILPELVSTNVKDGPSRLRPSVH